MSVKGLLATVAAAAWASVLAIPQTHASEVALLPGTPADVVTTASLPDPFKIIFDENGNAIVAQWNGKSYDPYTILKPNPGGFLTWTLPGLVVPGDVSFAEPPTTACTSASNCSDGLRFTNDGKTSTMLFFSDTEPGQVGGPLADTGFPSNFDFTTFAFQEVGPETGLNGFIYKAGPGDPSVTNFYTGISDVPEASTWAMMIIGFAGLGFVGYRVSQKRVALA